MDTDDVRRLAFVTRRFRELQGLLRFVTFLFLTWAAVTVEALPDLWITRSRTPLGAIHADTV